VSSKQVSEPVRESEVVRGRVFESLRERERVIAPDVRFSAREARESNCSRVQAFVRALERVHGCVCTQTERRVIHVPETRAQDEMQPHTTANAPTPSTL
jgi:hypothetical protein